MPSTQYLNMMETKRLFVFPDFKPWGGFSPGGAAFTDFRVNKCTFNFGSTFDSVELVSSSKSFGDVIPYFTPIKIIYIDSQGTQLPVFRGFINSDNHKVASSGDIVTVTALDYKWLYSRRTVIRGRWYKNTQASAFAPFQKGSGLTLGDGKFNFEKFRADPQDYSGYLQNDECVFNRGGFPDCFVDDTLGAGNKYVFFADTVGYDEGLGLPQSNYQKKDVDGYYWSYATILRHIEEYWIKPYNALFAGLDLHDGDMSDIQDIDEEISRPIDFSIENQNPMGAIDIVVKSLPGNWIWYLDYRNNSNRVKIRIKQILQNPTTPPVSLRLGSDCEKLVNSNANVSKVSVTRNVNRSVKNIIAKGGKIKLVTTIKLVPMWEALDNGLNFESTEQMNDYVTFLRKFLKDGNNAPDKIFPDNLTSKEKLRFLTLFRKYAIPLEGDKFAASIVNPSGTEIPIELVGDIAGQYSGGITDLRQMFFKNVKIDREISAPQFNRYCDDVVVFMYDELFGDDIKLNADGVVNRSFRIERSDMVVSSQQIQNASSDSKWVIPKDGSDSYTLDEKNGIVVFDKPQFRRFVIARHNGDDNLLPTATFFYRDGSLDKFLSREVYMTATFTADYSAVISKKVTLPFDGPSVVDLYGGPPITEHITSNDQDIVIHKNAFYPLDQDNKDADDPSFINDTMDQKTMGSVIRAAESFDNYRTYLTRGALELMRAINSFLQGFSDFDERGTCEFPYLELSYQIGQRILSVDNSNYTDLRSHISQIVYSAVADSDHYVTTFQFTNQYARDKTNVSNVSNRNEKVDCTGQKRQIPDYVNLAENNLI